MSPNGWTDDFLGLQWFENVFIPHATSRNTSGKPILLIWDGHGSHESLELIDLARANNIILLSLPPHTTHKLQPLDVGVFGPFQRAWIERCDEIVEDTGEEMPRADFVREYMAVREASFKKENVLSAWRKCGISPFDPDIFTDEDYAPSIPFSFAAPQLPQNFPSYDASLPTLPVEPEDDMDDADETVPSADFTRDESQADARASSSSREDVPGSVPTVPPASFYAPISPASTPTQNPSYTRTKRRRTDDDSATLEGLPSPARRYIENLESQLETTTAHCSLAQYQIKQLQHKLTKRTGKKTSTRKFNVEARVLTSDEGRQAAADARKAAEDKAAQQKENRDARAQKELEEQQRRETRSVDEPFVGSLTSRNLPDLKDVAYALNLSLDGTKKAILERIQTHFTSNPTLRDSPRFIGLFQRVRRQKRTASDANLPHAEDQHIDPQLVPLAHCPSTMPVTHHDWMPIPGPSRTFGDALTFNQQAIPGFPAHNSHYIQYPPTHYSETTAFHNNSIDLPLALQQNLPDFTDCIPVAYSLATFMPPSLQ
jgi:hypothetical protein